MVLIADHFRRNIHKLTYLYINLQIPHGELENVEEMKKRIYQ